MTTMGLLLRVDQGGLAAQTATLAQLLKPDVVLAIDLPEHKRRGDSQLHRYTDLPITAVATTDSLTPRLLAHVADQVDTLVTVECLYTNPAGWQAVNERCTTVLIANPELYAGYPAHRIVLPTSWHADRFPHAHIVPHPVDTLAAARDRRTRSGLARTFLHVEAPAMLDRNGTDLVTQALPFVDEPCTLTVRSYRPAHGLLAAGRVGKVTVRWDHSRPVDWRDCYPADTDVLLLPRRYGGLSLVVQEAASLGIPPVMLDVEPQRSEDWPGWRLPATVWRRSLMRGGEFDVHTTRPEALAATMTALARGGLDVEGESRRALMWAEARAWPNVAAQWEHVLARQGALDQEKT